MKKSIIRLTYMNVSYEFGLNLITTEYLLRTIDKAHNMRDGML